MRTLDLFCGAGGMALGFQNAGHDLFAGVDVNETALETYRENLGTRVIHQDLEEVGPDQFEALYDITVSDVELIIGGPPCKGFSHSYWNRRLDDERNNLVFVFAEYVDHFQPDAFVMENVPGMATMDTGRLIERLMDDFETAGYNAEWASLNAVRYGVPQLRPRIFVIGGKDGEIQFPEPTHYHPDDSN